MCKTESCDGCKWSSDVQFIAVGGDNFPALCLNWQSTERGHYVNRGCDKYERGQAIDVPSRNAE